MMMTTPDTPPPADTVDTVVRALITASVWALPCQEYDALDENAGEDYRDVAGILLAALAEHGAALMPTGGETREEWGVWWHGGDRDGIRLAATGLLSEAEADRVGPSKFGQYGITRYTKVHRSVTSVSTDAGHYTFAEHWRRASWQEGWPNVSVVLRDPPDTPASPPRQPETVQQDMDGAQGDGEAEAVEALTRGEAIAQRFHEAYERLAPSFGYKTRDASAKPWADVPEQNRALMTAVCVELLPDIEREARERQRRSDWGDYKRWMLAQHEDDPLVGPRDLDLVLAWLATGAAW